MCIVYCYIVPLLYRHSRFSVCKWLDTVYYMITCTMHIEWINNLYYLIWPSLASHQKWNIILYIIYTWAVTPAMQVTSNGLQEPTLHQSFDESTTPPVGIQLNPHCFSSTHIRPLCLFMLFKILPSIKHRKFMCIVYCYNVPLLYRHSSSACANYFVLSTIW